MTSLDFSPARPWATRSTLASVLVVSLTYDDLRAHNESLVYLQNTAFGPQGPLAEQGGYALIVQGLSGLVIGCPPK